MRTEEQFNIITDELQDSFSFPAKEGFKPVVVQLIPTAQRAIECLQILESTTLSDADKLRYIFERITRTSTEERRLYPAQILAGVQKFLEGPPTLKYQKSGLPSSGEKLVYWGPDSLAMTAAFRQAYGLSLEETRQLHYWEFCALLYNLPSDTNLSKLFAARAMPEPSDPKMSAEQRRTAVGQKRAARPEDQRSAEEKAKDSEDVISKGFGKLA